MRWRASRISGTVDPLSTRSADPQSTRSTDPPSTRLAPACAGQRFSMRLQHATCPRCKPLH
eukprot:22185-Chlamydomonas_euryale.AAC.2